MMQGMLWFDNDPNMALVEKVAMAADYYRHKYGRQPTLCLVHPSMMTGNQAGPDGIVIRPYRAVLPGHLWIGEEDHAAKGEVSVPVQVAQQPNPLTILWSPVQDSGARQIELHLTGVRKR